VFSHWVVVYIFWPPCKWQFADNPTGAQSSRGMGWWIQLLVRRQIWSWCGRDLGSC